jgi:hypothetical protein
MIYRKTNPVGIDYCIDVMQKDLYDRILELWSLTEDQVLSYPKVYRVSKTEGDTNEALRYYSSSSYLSHDMLLDNKYAVQFFFLPVGTSDYTNWLFHQDIEIVFYVNLTTIKPLITHRADTEVEFDIKNNLARPESFKGIGSCKGLPGFNELMDMQPFHSFKILTTITYD